MAQFEIPKGREYVFTITVLQKNSFLPQDLTALNLVTSKFELIKSSDLIKVTNTGVVLAVHDALNGILKVTLPSSYTGSLMYERGDKVDNYYPKPTYKALIYLDFTDITPDRTVVVDKVYIIPVGA